MGISKYVRGMIGRVFRRGNVTAEIEEEICSHIAHHADDLEREGVPRAEAERRARVKFGGRERYKEECHDALRQGSFACIANHMWSASQVRQVMRRFRRAPMFAFVSVITLAIGVGANAGVFSILEGVMLKPLPYPHSEQLVEVAHRAPELGIPDLSLAVSDYFIYREQGRYFQDIGLYQMDSVNVTGFSEPEQIISINVTEGTLPILGVRPMLGRWFSTSDTSPGKPLSAILTYSYWKRRFGGDRSAIGHTITTDGQLRQIIGVMPQNFQFVDVPRAELLIPMQLNRATVYIGGFSYHGVARLKPGATLPEANADGERLFATVLRSFPPFPGLSLAIFEKAHIGSFIRPLKQEIVGSTSQFLWILMGSIALVLLIACANVANLLLVRAEGRQQEFAIRTALGANRGRIASDLLLESTFIGLLGGAIGLGLAYGALRILIALAPGGIPRMQEIGIDLPVLVFALGISLLSSLLFGLIPVFKYGGGYWGIGLRDGGRTLSQSRERHRARNTLVVVQVALGCVLLVCSGLMIRTFSALLHVQPGFEAPNDVQTFRISIPESEVKDPEATVRMQEAIERKIATEPGVSSVAFLSAVPMDDQDWRDPVFARDRTYTEGEIAPLRRFVFVSPGLFQTLGVPVIAGRDFDWIDIHQKRPVAIISENFAREYWKNPTNALGKQIRSGSKDDWREIIGVVGDVYAQGTNQGAPHTAYWPVLMSQFESGPIEVRRMVSFVVRTPRAGSQSLMHDLQQAVWSIDGNLPLTHVQTLGDFYEQSMARTTFTLAMIAIAGGMALVLGMVGLYGVLSYSVSQRTREIGVRVALGAQRRAVARMFVGQGLSLAGVGVMVGLGAAAAATRLMSSVLFRVSPLDPWTYSIVCIVLLLIAALASYIPSRRAAGVDPAEALRRE